MRCAAQLLSSPAYLCPAYHLVAMLPHASMQQLTCCHASSLRPSPCMQAPRCSRLQLAATRHANPVEIRCRRLTAPASARRSAIDNSQQPASTAASSAADAGSSTNGRSASVSSDSNGGANHPGWDPACSAFLAKQLDVSPDEAADWLNMAARKRELAAARTANGGDQPADIIRLADMQLLLTTLGGDGGMSAAGIRKLLAGRPRLLLAAEAEAIADVVCFIRHELGVSAEKAAKTLQRQPNVLAAPVALMRSRREALQHSLALSSRDEQRMYGRSLQPLLRTTSLVEASISAAISAIGCSRKAFGSMIARQPSLLHSRVSALQTRLNWCTEKGWSQQQTADMVCREPGVLCQTIEMLQARFDWWGSNAGFSQQQTADMLWAVPVLFSRDLDGHTATRKLRFFNNIIGRPLTRLGDCKRYLTYSLEDRIAPRTCYLLAHDIPLTRSLAHLAYVDERFFRRFKVSAAAFAEWMAEWRQTPEGQLWGTKPDPAPSER